jgi:steroid delta-isomerase-like uncharacterized protein
MSEENKAAIRSLFDALNAGNLDGLADGLADDMIEHEELPGLTPNKDGVIMFFRGCLAAFEGFRINIDDMLAEGDKVTVRGLVTGKHVGEFMGVPASGNDMSVPLADYFRLEGGKVKEHWGVMDTGTMMMQMGAMG